MQCQPEAPVDYPHDVATLRRILKEKDDVINDLKFCLASADGEVQGLQKQMKSENSVSTEITKAEICKLFPMLTSNQISLMTKEKKQVQWTVDEIANGFTHSYFGKRGYNFTIHNLGIPKPSIRTLQRWAQKMKVAPGFLDDSFVVLDGLSKTYAEAERQVRSLKTFLTSM